MSISLRIGLMLMNIGLGSNTDVYSKTGDPFYVMLNFFAVCLYNVTNMGDDYAPMVLSVCSWSSRPVLLRTDPK